MRTFRCFLRGTRRDCFVAAILSACLMVGANAWGYAELRIYKPGGATLGTNEYAYWGTIKSDYKMVERVTSGKAGANSDSGGVAAFAGAFIGGSFSRAGQYVGFTVPEPCHVYATVKLAYTGDTTTYGFASWAGTAWEWQVDDGRWHPEDIDAAFTLETVGGKVLDLAFLAAGGFAFPAEIEALIDVLENTWSMIQLAQEINSKLLDNQAKRIEKTVHFTVPAGTHTFSVGLRATGSALATGSSFAFIQGQVEEIRLGLNSQEGLYPDLTISAITPENETDLRTTSIVDLFIERSNIGNADADLETYELRTMPGDGRPSVLIRQRGGFGVGSGFTPIDAYTTRSEHVRHAFTQKGTYVLFGWEDPDSYVMELDELNNQSFKIIRVLGTVPNAPLAPNLGYPLTLYRNQTSYFFTSATEPDGDLLFYRFELSAGGGDWLGVTNGFNATSNGWSTALQLAVTPVLADPDLLPKVSAGIDAKSYVTLATNDFRIRAQAGDEDGASAYSADKALTVVLNTMPDRPVLVGDTLSDTMQGVSITASSNDLEGDQIAFRFDWGDNLTPTWTDWIWCVPGTNSVTVSHLYTASANYSIAVEATDLYSAKYTSPISRSVPASHCVWISDYYAPRDSIVVTTKDKACGERLPNVGFSISGGTNLTAMTSLSGYWQGSALPGTYTITFTNVAGYCTPASQTFVLSHQGSIQFCGQYEHQTGGIVVNCNIAGKGRLSGQGTALGNNHTFSGLTWSAAGVWAGEHAIEYEAVDSLNYGLPIPPRETNTLALNGTVTFWGRYIRRPILQVALVIPTNSYLPPNAFLLADEDAIYLDASSSYSPTQPTGDLFPPLTLTVTGYRFDYDDIPDYMEDAAHGAPDGILDGKTRRVFHRPGRRQIAVTVTDSAGCSSVVTNVQVWVKERPVATITIDPSPAIAGECVTFSAEGTDNDAGDQVVGYEWTSSVAGVFSTNQVFACSNLAVGIHEISLRVQANDLVWSKPATVFLEVCVPHDWPAFKRNSTRLSNQPSYADRAFGQLPYGLAGGNWPFLADSPIEGSPVAANLDGDYNNGLEVVFVSRLGTLYATDSTGQLRWSTSVGPSSSTPAVGDINGDGQPEIVVGSRTGVYAFDRRGTNLYAYSGTTSFEYSMPVVADVDPRSRGSEILLTADDGSVHLICSDGTRGTNQWPFSYATPLAGAQMFAPAPAVAELDLDHLGREVVVGGIDGKLYLLNSSGSNIASFLLAGTPPIRTTPAIADLCPQVPGAEILFGADNGVFYCLNYHNGQFTQVWQYAVSPPAMIRSSPAVGMVGEAARSQVVFGCDNGIVYVLNGTDGTLAGSYSCGLNVMIRSTPAIADIDTIRLVPPSQPEVICGAANGTLYALNFAMGGRALWTNRLSGMPIFSSPAVADINHDPDLEILVGANDNGLYLLKAAPDPAQIPVVDFAASPTSGGRPLSVTFTNLTLTSNAPGSLSFWRWDFGDGNTTSASDPTHVYQTPGVFSVTLTARNAHGSRTMTKTNYITVAPVPLADFFGGPLLGDVPVTVSFTNLSKFVPTAWSWDFGDGTLSANENPLHTYTAPGTYTVSLSVSNPYGSNTLANIGYITVRAVCPVADFALDPKSGCAPLTVRFTDRSTSVPTSWLWNFGDGSTSAERNPVHTYDNPGRYLVSLTVTNAGGSDTRASANYLGVLATTPPHSISLVELRFDEGAGPVAYDVSTNQNHGTIVGATWISGGQSGTALSFAGGGQFSDGNAVVVPHSPSLNVTNPFSVEAWIKVAGSDQYLAIVDQYEHRSEASSSGFTLYLTGGLLRFSLYSGAAGTSGWGTTDLRDDAWHHVAGAWDGSFVRVYVDSVLQGEVVWPYPPAPTTANVGIGKRLSGWGGYMPFSGIIDEVRISRLQPVIPPALSLIRFGPQFALTWTTCSILQTASDLAGPWADISEAYSPYLLAPEDPCRFYRLRLP